MNQESRKAGKELTGFGPLSERAKKIFAPLYRKQSLSIECRTTKNVDPFPTFLL
jgi:hypothetical protein